MLIEHDEVPVRGCLFDLDGTLIQSRAAIERILGAWAWRVGVDAAQLIADSHGRRTRDIVSGYCPTGFDIERETGYLDRLFLEDTDDVTAITGAAAFLDNLGELPWAIVTSCDRELALHRLAAAGLPRPTQLVAAEDVQRGKPDPQGYLLGAQRLGLDVRQLMVFEDAPAGVAAGLAAGARVTVIGAQVPPPGTSLAVRDYRELSSCIAADGSRWIVRTE